MKPYELTYIISSEITSEQAEAESKNIESLIQGKEGIILKSVKLSPKTLAYSIKKQSSGFFGVLEFQLEPEHLGEIKEKIQKNGNIIRHMIVINNPAKIQKERRIRRKPIEENKEPAFTAQADKKTSKKVELREIEKELDEILSE
ncbi:MAG: 30S ribosomal protein S6 [Candidatus Staskawiczbacteria bacterium]|nr:30S ribosomal protein S6 [Candidatus Staskawiczbacteria bacterium]